MKRFLCTILIVVLLSICPLSIAESLQTITVTGSASVSVKADYATINFGVVTYDADVSIAATKNAQNANSLILALEENGIKKDDITTDYFSVNTIYDYDYAAEGQRIKGYQVDNTISVKIHDIEKIGIVIDTAIKSGANNCNGISFGSSQENAAYDKSLALAVEDAERKANIIADVSNMRIISIGSISEEAQNYNIPRFGRIASLTKATNEDTTQVINNGLNFSASVVVTYIVTNKE